jgi:hypothetical protein
MWLRLGVVAPDDGMRAGVNVGNTEDEQMNKDCDIQSSEYPG